MTQGFHFRFWVGSCKAVIWGLSCFVVFISVASARPWTNKKGVVLEGELLGVDGKIVLIQRKSDGRRFRVPVDTLSAADQQFVANVVKGSKPGSGLIIPLPGAITASLKAYYAFDKKDRMGMDSSGTRSPLSLQNDCKMDWSETGLVGGAASFNGRNSTFWMRRLTALKNQPISISCWIKTSNKEEQEIFAFGATNQGG